MLANLRTPGGQYQQKDGCGGSWEAKKIVLLTDTGAAKETGSKTETKIATDISEALEQKGRFTEKLTGKNTFLINNRYSV